jgi:hypothetical protein
MGLFSKRGAPVEGNDEGATLTLSNINEHYQVVDRVYNPTYGEAVIVTEKGTRVRGREAARKLAEANGQVMSLGKEVGTTKIHADYNYLFDGITALDTYDKMRRGDASVRAALRLAKTPVLAARWGVDAFDRNDAESVMHAKFIHDALFNKMTISWEQILTEAMLMLEFGWYGFEMVFDTLEWEGAPHTMWKKWAPRSPLDMGGDGWVYDEHGGPEGVWMLGKEGQPDVFIEIAKMVVFTYDREANNMEGISILRSAYKHWYYKENLYKIDAIQKERHGIGVPVIKLPPGFTPTDKNLADELGRNLRTNEQAHVVLPPYWELMFAKVEGQPTNPIESIQHHDKQIAKNVLGQFVDTGAAASKEQEIDLFMKAIRFTADIVRATINKHAIPQLMNYNFPDVTDYPVLKARRIGEVNELRTLSFAFRNFVGANTIIPDDRLEEWVRDELDMPIPDKSTSRVEEKEEPTGGTPRDPNNEPRQSPPSNTKPTTGKGDNSGG